MPNYVPSVSDATQDARAFPTKFQTRTYSVNPPNRVTGQWDLKPHSDELLALIKGRVSSPDYGNIYDISGTVNVGDPVYVVASNQVAKADATDIYKSKICGWCRFKPTSTTALIEHFHYATGLSSLTVANDVYLTDSGSYSSTSGTVPVVVGVAVTGTTAALTAVPGGTVAEGRLGTGSVTTAKLADNSVTTVKIVDANVTAAKLAETYCRWRGSSTGTPASPIDGDLYHENGDGLVYIYHAGNWSSIL